MEGPFLSKRNAPRGRSRPAVRPGDLTISMALVPDIANETARHQPGRGALQSSVARLRESIAIACARAAAGAARLGALPAPALRAARFAGSSTRRPAGPIGCRWASSTKRRCGATCTASSATSATCSTSRASGARSCRSTRCAGRFPTQPGLQVSLTGGEIFMRKDILRVLDLFREKGYDCGYLTTNGTIISEERAEALADLAAAGFLKHISVSIDGPGELHDKARGLKGTFERTCARAAPAAGGGARASRRRCGSASTRPSPTRASTRSTRWWTSPSELGVDAIGLNHLMFSTPDEVDETVRLIGASDPSVICHVRHAGSRARRRARAPEGRRARREVPAARTCCSTCVRRCTRS